MGSQELAIVQRFIRDSFFCLEILSPIFDLSTTDTSGERGRAEVLSRGWTRIHVNRGSDPGSLAPCGSLAVRRGGRVAGRRRESATLDVVRQNVPGRGGRVGQKFVGIALFCNLQKSFVAIVKNTC